MVVGFFSDDGSAHYAALLTACGLASVRRPVTVIEGHRTGAPIRTDLAAAVAQDACGRLDVFLVGTLDLVRETDIASFLDIAVVSGADPLQVRRATRSAGYLAVGAAAPGAGGPVTSGAAVGRPWLLPFGARRPGRNAAPASWLRARGGRPPVRTLPVRVPLGGRSVEAAMEHGLPTLETLRIGIMLAATLEIAAADPDAVAIGRAAMAELLFSEEQPADRALAGRLSDLAAQLDDVERAAGTRVAPIVPGRLDRSRRRLGRRVGPAVSRECSSGARDVIPWCR